MKETELLSRSSNKSVSPLYTVRPVGQMSRLVLSRCLVPCKSVCQTTTETVTDRQLTIHPCQDMFSIYNTNVQAYSNPGKMASPAKSKSQANAEEAAVMMMSVSMSKWLAWGQTYGLRKRSSRDTQTVLQEHLCHIIPGQCSAVQYTTVRTLPQDVDRVTQCVV